MAPAHSKPLDRKRAAESQFCVSPMSKIAKGCAVFTDDFVDAMAEGRKVALPKNLDEIVVDVDSEKENESDSEKEDSFTIHRCSKKVKSYKSSLDLEEVDLCPKYGKRNAFAIWEDASFYSDGELKQFHIKCQETESSPCSFCSGDSGEDNYVKTPSPKRKGSEFAQAKGFDINNYEGEEDTPKKMAAGIGKLCKWCEWDPCILEDDEVNEEARVIVDNLMAQEAQGIDVTHRNYRYALYRMYARALGYKQVRQLLPVCVQAFLDKNFSYEGEERTGFKAK